MFILLRLLVCLRSVGFDSLLGVAVKLEKAHARATNEIPPEILSHLK